MTILTTILDMDPDQVLEGAKGELESVIVIGEKENGDFWFASSTGNIPINLWMVEKFKRYLIDYEINENEQGE